MAKILVVDDETDLREILIARLTKAGHTVLGAEDGKDAQNVLTRDDVDVVVCDIRMPRSNGIDFLRWVQQKRSLPVILMTGHTSIAEATDATALGAAAFLTKPFDEEDLLAVLERVLRESSSRK